MLAIVGGHTHRIFGIALVQAVYHISYLPSVVLRGAKHQRLLVGLDVRHKLLHAGLVTLLDINVAGIEILLRIHLAFFHLACQHFVLWTVDIVVYRALHLAMPKGCQKAVVDALFQRILIYGVAKVTVGVGVYFASWGSRHAYLHSGTEIVQYAPPVALVPRTSSVALVHNHQVEEVLRVLAKEIFALLARHKGLEDGKEHRSVGGHFSVFPDAVGLYAYKGIGGKAKELVEGLVGKHIAVGQKQDAGAVASLLHVPFGLEQFPCNLEGNKGFSRPCGKRQQYAVFSRSYGRKGLVDGYLLIIARYFRPIVEQRLLVELVAPLVSFAESPSP